MDFWGQTNLTMARSTSPASLVLLGCRGEAYDITLEEDQNQSRAWDPVPVRGLDVDSRGRAQTGAASSLSTPSSRSPFSSPSPSSPSSPRSLGSPGSPRSPRSLAPLTLTLNVHIVDPAAELAGFPLYVGEGSQTFRWLSLAIAQRHRQMSAPSGRVRQRESIASLPGQLALACMPSGASLDKAVLDRTVGDVAGDPTGAADGHARLRNSVEPDMTISSVLRPGEDVWVTLNKDTGRVSRWHTRYFQSPRKVPRFRAIGESESSTGNKGGRTGGARRKGAGAGAAGSKGSRSGGGGGAGSSGSTEGDRSGGKWKLSRSVWSARVRQADSKAMYDTANAHEAALAADLFHCDRVAKLARSGPVYESIQAALTKWYRAIREIYRLVCCLRSTGGHFALSSIGFATFCAAAGLAGGEGGEQGGGGEGGGESEVLQDKGKGKDRGQGKGKGKGKGEGKAAAVVVSDLDRIFITVNVQTSKKNINNPKAASRFEFVEAIVRMSKLKYVWNTRAPRKSSGVLRILYVACMYSLVYGMLLE